MKIDKPMVLRIKKIVSENSRIKSFYFNYALDALPGQFIMVWIAGYDEKPFGVTVLDDKTFLISVAVVGDSTKHLHSMKVGDKIGIRGPYGSSFILSQKSKKITLVAGGYGLSPLSYLALYAAKKGYKVDLLLGARSKGELIKYPYLKHKNIKQIVATDDGSEGFSGTVIDLFNDYLKKNKPSKVYIVGPEFMEKKAVDICYAKKIPFQVSVERYMKCCIGICGQCCVDDIGIRMCTEGPVLDDKILKKVSEFGKYKRTASGKIINL